MTDFVTIADVKTYLGNDNANDKLLKLLIQGIQKQIQTRCGWAIEETQFQQYHPAIYDPEFDTHKIFLKYAPVTEMIGACYNGVELVENTEFVLNYDLGIVDMIGMSNVILMNTAANYAPVVDSDVIFFANYKAGYESIPEDLKLAMYKQIYKEYNERGGGLKTYSSSTMSYSRPDTENGFLPEVNDILRNYTARNFG